ALTSRTARAISSSLVTETTFSAPLDTSDRCDVRSPKPRRLSNTHCMVRPGNPTSTCSVTTRSNQRFTVRTGDAAVGSAASSVARSDAGGSTKTSESANQGTAQMMTGATNLSWRTLTCEDSIRAGALV